MRQPFGRRRCAGALLVASLLATAALAAAQRIMVAPGRVLGVAPKWATSQDFDGSFIRMFSPAGYALGVNIALYAMTH
jgi:hypothetical protein